MTNLNHKLNASCVYYCKKPKLIDCNNNNIDNDNGYSNDESPCIVAEISRKTRDIYVRYFLIPVPRQAPLPLLPHRYQHFRGH